jgi:hypothetical protein
VRRGGVRCEETKCAVLGSLSLSPVVFRRTTTTHMQLPLPLPLPLPLSLPLPLLLTWNRMTPHAEQNQTYKQNMYLYRSRLACTAKRASGASMAMPLLAFL